MRGSEGLSRIGGKNASLGEMLRHLRKAGVRVPPDFATTADAYRRFIEANDLENDIRDRIRAWEGDERPLAEAEGSSMVVV